MQAQTLISVIVPIYNCRQFIPQCVDSLLSQSLKDFELLLIDDGSTDDSGDICDAYQKKDKRVRAFHTLNGGPSKARNVGLDKAKGHWVTFVDGDDWVANDYLENLYRGAIQVATHNVCIIQGYTKISFSGGDEKGKTIPRHGHVYIPRRERGCFSEEKIDLARFNFSYGKLYSTDLIRKNQIKWEERVAFLEDLIFCMDYIKHVDIVVTIRAAGYYYRCGNPSSLSMKLYPVETESQTFDILKTKLTELKHAFNQTDDDMAYLSNAINSYFFRICRSLYSPLHKRGRRERINTLKTIFLRHDGEHFDIPCGGKFDKLFLALLKRNHWRTADSLYYVYIASRSRMRKMMR